MSKNLKLAGFILYGLLFLVAVNWLSDYALTYYPNTGDESSGLFQSKIFASFRLLADAPPLAFFFKGHYTEVLNGKWFSQYPPIFSLLMTPGHWLGGPNFWISLYALSCLFLIYRILLALDFKEGPSILVVLLYGLTPTYLFYSASLYNHIGQLLFYLIGLYFFVLYYKGGEQRHLIWVGIFITLQFGIRPYTAFLLSLPILGFCFLRIFQSSERLKGVLSLAIPFTIIMVIFLLYNYNQRGNFWEISYLLAGDNQEKLGLHNLSGKGMSRFFQMIYDTGQWLFPFGKFIGGHLKYTLKESINIGVLFIPMSCFFYLFQAFNFKGTWSRHQQTFFIIGVTSIFLLFSGHILYGASGGRYGERYFFEVTWFLFLPFIFIFVGFEEKVRKIGLALSTFIFLGFSLWYGVGTAKFFREANLKRMDPYLKTRALKESSPLIFLEQVPEFDPPFYTLNHPSLKGPVFVVSPTLYAGQIKDGQPIDIMRKIANDLSKKHFYLYHYSFEDQKSHLRALR